MVLARSSAPTLTRRQPWRWNTTSAWPFEQAGDLEAAREKFLQVYSQNVDYRDVADKIRQLAGKS